MKNRTLRGRGVTALVIGNATLFGALGCGSDDDGTAPTGGAATGGAQVDAAIGGGQPPPGGSPAPGGTPAGGTPAGGTPAGGTPAPGGAVPPAPDADLRLDAAVTDAAVPPPVDSAVPPTPDAAVPPTPDAAVPPTPDAAPPSACADLVGQPCEMQSDGCCEPADRPQLSCEFDANARLVWTVVAQPDLCVCDSSSGRTQVFCAVPGFVGITRAGRRQASGRRLRG